MLGAGGVTLLGALTAAGCDMLATDPAGSGRRPGGERGDTGAKEAPEFVERVASGDLEALGERLPRQPLVVQPREQPGHYGGTFHSALLGPADTPWLSRTIGYECLARWNLEWTEAIPNIAERWEASSDGTSYTFHLRPGMRWSDGEPFTAADMVFAYDDVLLNTDLYPSGVPLFLTTDAGPARVEQLEEHVVRISFDETNGLFLHNCAITTANLLTSHPKHYLQAFHPSYVDNADEVAEEAGFADWGLLFAARASVWENVDLPTLLPWTLRSALGSGSRLVAKRNPYYWKTDPDGRQLPYLDGATFDITADEQVILLKASNGELDLHTRHINILTNKPVLARNRDSGDFDFLTLEPAFENQMVIALNLTHEDPVLREIFRTKDFRIALSQAINRPQIVQTVFQRQGRPWQAAPRRESPFYDEEFASQYTDYDPDAANAALDRAGYTERNADGIRLRPDGRPISIAVEIASPSVVVYWPDAMELIADDWRAVGIHATTKPEDRSLFYERKEANKPDATVWTGAGGLQFDVYLDPRWYFPFSGESNFAIPWATWFTTGGEGGQAPPEPTQRQMSLYRQLQREADSQRRDELMREILSIAREEFYAIGVVMEEEAYGIVTNGLRNVPKSMPESHLYNTPAPANFEQFYFA